VQRSPALRKRLREKFLSRLCVLILTMVRQRHILPLVSLVSKYGSIVGISYRHVAVSQVRLTLRLLCLRHRSVKNVVAESAESAVSVESDHKASEDHVHHAQTDHKVSDLRVSEDHVHRVRINHKVSDRRGADHKASEDHVHHAQTDHKVNDRRVSEDHVHHVRTNHRVSDRKVSEDHVHHASLVRRVLRAVRVVVPIAHNQPRKHQHLRVVPLEPPRASRGELSHVIGTITYKISSTASRSYERPGHTRLHALIW
jgi:hypothetical protein